MNDATHRPVPPLSASAASEPAPDQRNSRKTDPQEADIREADIREADIREADIREADPAVRRPIRSFVLRQGRLSGGQQRALEQLGPRYVLPYTPEVLDRVAVFGRQAPLVLEIGFGMGQATAAIAAAMPEVDFLGVEVHSPGVGSLLKLIEQYGLPNLRIVQHDAVEVLQHMLPDGSLHGVHVFFPDPWPKARHHKRRLLQPALVAQLARKLAPGGYLHVATDWEDYAVAVLAVVNAEPLLCNQAAPRDGAPGYADKPAYRPLTKFEQRGLNLGHGVWDIVAHRV